ncbi:hypothetical protein BG004_003156 [Podila humilis]|nr:hypothetical protein BG004_003156 [Podila humilis]
MVTTIAPRNSNNVAQILQLVARIFTPATLSKSLGVYLLYILIKYRTTALGAAPRKDLPGPVGKPLIGNLYELLTRPRQENYQRQTEYHDKYGSWYTVTLLGVGRVINIISPEDLDHILRINFWAYEKGSMMRTNLEPLVGQGIFGADGQHWRWQRKLSSNIFTVRAFRDWTTRVFCADGDLVRAYFDRCVPSSLATEGKVVDLSDVFYKYTLDSFGSIAYGESFGCLQNPEQEVEFASAFDRLNNTLSNRFMNPFWKVSDWWTGNDKQIAKDIETVQGFAYGVISRRRLQQQQQGQEEQNDKGYKDLMQLFLDAKDESGNSLDDEMLKDTLMNFILAGRDTTAQALSWMFYLIHRSGSRKEEILGKLRQEIDSVLQGGYPTYEATKLLKYTEACFHETLRIFPSVPQNVKVCVEDDVLPSGFKVKKGERIGWCSWAMGRDTKIWGPDAAEFKPERWLTGEKPSSSKFVSFHLGPRTW